MALEIMDFPIKKMMIFHSIVDSYFNELSAFEVLDVQTPLELFSWNLVKVDHIVVKHVLQTFQRSPMDDFKDFKGTI